MDSVFSDEPVSGRSSPMKEVRCWSPQIHVRRSADGSLYIEQVNPTLCFQERVADALHYWARQVPDRTILAQKTTTGTWRRISYAECLVKIRRLGQYLLSSGLSKNDPLAILSGNDLEHALISLAATYVGIPYVPISPTYSAVGPDYARLNYTMDVIRPKLIFASSAEKFRPAITCAASGIRQLYVEGAEAPTECFGTAVQTEVTPEVDEAFDRTNGDTIVKYLFTSGSTGTPKAVINTNRMICSNQAMIQETFAFLKDEPPVLLDWAPWHHTGGGNKVFYMNLFNGGTLHIDDGRPSGSEIERTAQNIIDVSPNWYFNVPAGFDALIPHLHRDEKLRECFFKNLKMIWYAGAAMRRQSWEELEALAVRTTGRRVLIATGLGSTESAPAALMCSWAQNGPGNVGLPCIGVSLKLVPADDKYEARLKGPNVMPGYHEATPANREVFDDEGYYRTGDALSFHNSEDITAGFNFEGRLEENFKLDTGTWVNVSDLRSRLLEHFGSIVKDVAIAGANQSYLGALVFPDLSQITKVFGPSPAESFARAVANVFREKLLSFSQSSRGSSTDVRRIIIMEEPLSALDGEITDKGSINQRAVLHRRQQHVEALYSDAGYIIAV